MRLKPSPEVPEEPGQFWKDFIRDTAPEFRKSTLDQLSTLIRPIWSELIDGAILVNGQLKEILEEVGLEVNVQENVVEFPALTASGVPWLRNGSCNPIYIHENTMLAAF